MDVLWALWRDGKFRRTFYGKWLIFLDIPAVIRLTTMPRSASQDLSRKRKMGLHSLVIIYQPNLSGRTLVPTITTFLSISNFKYIQFRMSTMKPKLFGIQIWWYVPDFPIDIRIRLAELIFCCCCFLTFLPCWLAQFCWDRQQGWELAKSWGNKKKFQSYSYVNRKVWYVSSNLNSKQLRFLCAHPNVHALKSSISWEA